MLCPPQLLRRRRSFGVLAVWLAAVAAIVFRAELAGWLAADRSESPGAPAAFYTCSMDPSVEADRPGVCPLCGMALTPVSREDRASGIVRVAPRARQQIGLAIGKVETRTLRTRIAATGEVVATAGDRASLLARVYRGDASTLPAGVAVAATVADLPLTELVGALAAPLAGDAPGMVRAEVDNPDQVLRPGARVELHIDLERPPQLTVPATAVLYAGPRRIAFVDLGHGRYEPRAVKLGVQAGGFVEIIDGLTEDNRVVVGGAFLLAAESRLRSDGALWTDRTRSEP
ncbi:MAG TPA: heavy metal-binding domain-containing protein [Kofleriaceae bacterium]|nr:heavy metal-binding domain-containing protein [Kofleriaceae bacterium]